MNPDLDPRSNPRFLMAKNWKINAIFSILGPYKGISATVQDKPPAPQRENPVLQTSNYFTSFFCVRQFFLP
jgi:hypothetical protein